RTVGRTSAADIFGAAAETGQVAALDPVEALAGAQRVTQFGGPSPCHGKTPARAVFPRPDLADAVGDAQAEGAAARDDGEISLLHPVLPLAAGPVAPPSLDGVGAGRARKEEGGPFPCGGGRKHCHGEGGEKRAAESHEGPSPANAGPQASRDPRR